MVKATPLAIDIHNLSLWYGDFQALFEVDLQVKQGLITALIGPSGCGKSTLLRAVNRINERLGDYVRTTGEIHVLDQDILRNDIELAQLRRHVGMVFQRPNPLPLSVRDNVLTGSTVPMRSSTDGKRTRSLRMRSVGSCSGMR